MIKTIEQLNEVKSQYQATVAFRHPGATEKDSYKRHVLVCAGTGCTSSGSVKIAARIEELLEEKGLKDEVKVIKTGCHGL
ncbi:MAG: (2Fe-2S) ferredoxin domain-containing protein, partial [Lachnospiraceae bacterium]|nr:(2Fe-2S) ferredoxin domain-containing protein [Lachnospiraceae bacterium]